MSFNYLPNADAAFLAWTANFATLLDNEGPIVGMTTAQVTAYVAKQAAYAALYAIADQPTTRTRPAIQDRNTVKAELATMTRGFVRIMQASPAMTDTLRRSFQITVPKSRSTIGVPTARPTVRTVSAVQRTIVADIFDAASATKRGRAPLTAGAKVYTYVGASYPSDPTLWSYQGDYTKARVEIEMPGSVAGGSQVWIMAAWYNAKGETGPIAEPVSINIPGFGASELASPAMKIAA